MIIYRILRNIIHGLKQAAGRFVEAHIVQEDPCTSELLPDETEALLRGGNNSFANQQINTGWQISFNF